MPPDDTLTLQIGGRRFLGWQEVRVTRGIERMPSDFDLRVTERNPDGSKITIKPGDTCAVLIGKDPVLTGYVDRYRGDIAPGQHGVSVSGRSKCEDLVDCAAIYDGGQVVAGNVLQLASDIAKPYGISASGEQGRSDIPQTNINLGETCWEIIDRVARYSALLAYDDVNGNLVLASVGTTLHASGFEQGVNVQSASIAYGMDQRYSEYFAAHVSVDQLSELGPGGLLYGRVTDTGVPRLRRRVIVSEQTTNSYNVAEARATWERNRRIGRSMSVTLTCDTWRDSAGLLWQPNQLAPVHIPALKLNRQKWLISEVSYGRDERSGTTAQVTLMPPEAFTVEPTAIGSLPKDLSDAINDANRGSGASADPRLNRTSPAFNPRAGEAPGGF